MKLHLSWERTCLLRAQYDDLIKNQPLAPDDIMEGNTDNVAALIQNSLHTEKDLCAYLNTPANQAFFARTCNTRYLSLFEDINLNISENRHLEQRIKLYTSLAEDGDQESIRHYYTTLFGVTGDDNALTENEIMALTGVFDNVFMSYDNFCLLVQRKRPVNVSPGLFLLSLLRICITSEDDWEDELYLNFKDPEDFRLTLNDILTYHDFPSLTPALDSFEHLLLDTYSECLETYPDVTNTEFKSLFLNRFCQYLRMMAAKVRLGDSAN